MRYKRGDLKPDGSGKVFMQYRREKLANGEIKEYERWVLPDRLVKEKARKKKYYEENRQKCVDYGNDYHKNNRGEILKKQKAYRKNNPEKVKQHRKKYLSKKENVEKSKYRSKKYYKNNKSRLNKKRGEEIKFRLKNDPIYRFVHSARNRIRGALKAQSTSKNSPTLKLLGCSGEEFMVYLLSHPNNSSGKFTAENYGEAWHVDHVRPLSSFDLSKDQERRQAFHYSNCQPLTPEENLRKGSNIHDQLI